MSKPTLWTLISRLRWRSIKYALSSSGRSYLKGRGGILSMQSVVDWMFFFGVIRIGSEFHAAITGTWE